MLRINVARCPDGTTIALEGRVVGPWVDELRQCWQHVRRSALRPLRVTLDGVTFVDDAGKAVLRSMHADGAILTAATVMMRALADEVTGAPRSYGA
jgi:hypothetical protein